MCAGLGCTESRHRTNGGQWARHVQGCVAQNLETEPVVVSVLDVCMARLRRGAMENSRFWLGLQRSWKYSAGQIGRKAGMDGWIN